MQELKEEAGWTGDLWRALSVSLVVPDNGRKREREVCFLITTMNELCIGFIEKELWFYSHSFSQQQWCMLLMTLEQANSSQFQVLAAGTSCLSTALDKVSLSSRRELIM